jgi:NADPH:quinone reductase-like Zn-dependent oxidoreductase
MKRVIVDHFGGPEVLRVVETDDPRPGSGEVRVRVLAAGVSYTDAMLRAGTYLGVPKRRSRPATSSSASSRSSALAARGCESGTVSER